MSKKLRLFDTRVRLLYDGVVCMTYVNKNIFLPSDWWFLRVSIITIKMRMLYAFFIVNWS